MKKIFMLAAMAATIFAVSCNRAQGPALDEEEDNTPVAVKFSANAAAVSGVVKAAIDEFTGAETLYIYGIDTDGNILINNIPAESPELEAGAGKAAIEVWDPHYAPEEVPFFYGSNGEVYDFYGYYVGDADDDPQPEADGLTLEVEFDGTNDIMLATTDKAADYEERTGDFNASTVYSAKAARKDVQPNLIFKHQLSRFVFLLQFRPASQAENAEFMTIQEITLWTPSNTVTLDIDDQTALFEGEEDTFELKNIDGSKYEGGAIDGENWTQAGESIMVAPGESVYHMTMSYDYEYNGVQLDNLPPFEWDINLPALIDGAAADYKAEAGKKYIVKLVVYGPQEVKVSVSLEPWDEVELNEIDPDAEDEE